jgi:hypothetical protein
VTEPPIEPPPDSYWYNDEKMTAWIKNRLRNQDNGTEEEDFRGARNFAAVILRKVFPVPGETPFDRAMRHASWCGARQSR